MENLETNKSTYEVITNLEALTGVYVCDYYYILDGDVIDGYGYCKTSEVKDNEFIPVVKIICVDGFVESTNFKNIAKKAI